MNPLPPWVRRAYENRGQGDTSGIPALPITALWWPRLCAWWGDASVLDSGRIASEALRQCGMSYPRRWWMARAWMDWGADTDPRVGAVAVCRSPFGCCVGFVVDTATMQVIARWPGEDGVRVAPAIEVICYRWPESTASQVQRLLGDR